MNSNFSTYSNFSTQHALGVTLAVLAASTGSAVQAQTLSLGDPVNVGSSLHGTAVLTGTGASASGTYTYNDGGTKVPLAKQHSFSSVRSAGPSTLTVRGGTIGSLVTVDRSITVITGGNIGQLNFGSPTVSISGGTLGNVRTTGTTVNFTGGTLSSFQGTKYATFNVSGGTITTAVYMSNIYCTANVSGGNIAELDVSNYSTITVTGGSIGPVYCSTNGTIDFDGTHLKAKLLSTDPSSGVSDYEVTGTLKNGQPLDTDVYQDHYQYSDGTTADGVLEFNGVVVPGTTRG